MTAHPNIAEIERLLEMMGPAKRDGLLGAVLGCEMELAGHVPALLTALKAERARVAELEAALEWRPIETAPSTSFLSESVRVLVYSKQLGVRDAIVNHFENGSVYVSVSSFHGCARENWGVTHWLPLPLPPKERS